MTKKEEQLQEIIDGLERRIRTAIAAHADDWRWWENNAQQSLRWLEVAKARVIREAD